MSTVVSSTALGLLLAGTLLGQSPAQQQRDEQQRELQRITRNLEEIRRQNEAAEIARRRGQPSRPPIFSNDGSPLTLGDPGWNETEAERLRRNYETNRALKLDERRVVVLEKLAPGTDNTITPAQSVAVRPPTASNMVAATTQAEYDRAFEASEALAKKEFPWMGDPQSELYQRVRQVDAELERLKIPLFEHPDKPYILAHIVAHEAAVSNALKRTSPKR